MSSGFHQHGHFLSITDSIFSRICSTLDVRLRFVGMLRARTSVFPFWCQVTVHVFGCRW